MTLLLGGIGWGLLTIGAITHIWHHDRLRDLLALHLDHERLPAIGLTTLEALLAIALPAAVLTDSSMLSWFAVVGTLLALGFIVWIVRLLSTGSSLPCACSFSEAPTSGWSLARALCVALVGLLAWGTEASAASTTATLATGLAGAAAIFVAPEALAWPSTSRALLARVDAFATGANE